MGNLDVPGYSSILYLEDFTGPIAFLRLLSPAQEGPFLVGDPSKQRPCHKVRCEEAEPFAAGVDYVVGCRSEVRFDFSKKVEEHRGVTGLERCKKGSSVTHGGLTKLPAVIAVFLDSPEAAAEPKSNCRTAQRSRPLLVQRGRNVN